MRHHHHHDQEHGHHGHVHGHFRNSLHALLHAIGRHHHQGRGYGRGGHGFGGDGDDMPRGRMVSSDDLQLLLLSLLEQEPRHGYELIKALVAHSNGFYNPSPGMVYPALTYLEELGYVTSTLEGNRKSYQVAQAGREYLAENKERADGILARLKEIGLKMDRARRAFSGEGNDADEQDHRSWHRELGSVRHSLKHLLLHAIGAPAKRQKEIAAILRRAVEDIEKLDHDPE
jgi:DNA-binding PadR family transcriptional regulator